MLKAPALIQDDIVVLGLIAATLGLIFFGASRKSGLWKKFFGVVPPLLLCYFIPGIYNSVGLIDGSQSHLYNPVASRVLLPAALVLLTLTVDLRAIVKLGPKLLLIYVATSASVMLGGILAFLLMRFISPETMAGDTWAGMAALAGSWIGGGANMLAMKEVFHVDATTFGQFAVVDAGVAYVWMALLLLWAQRAAAMDAKRGADTRALDTLRERVSAYKAAHERVPGLNDWMLLIGIAFGAVGLSHAIAKVFAAWLGSHATWAAPMGLDQAFPWMIAICTLIGLGLSLTRARTLEGVGASTLGTVLLYFLIASIGMQMDIGALLDKPMLFLLGVIWLALHAVLLWCVARLLRVPFFYFAVGSQSHIGGPASAPVVAAAFHPALAPVGALLGTLGYATGTVLAYVMGLALKALAN